MSFGVEKIVNHPFVGIVLRPNSLLACLAFFFLLNAESEVLDELFSVKQRVQRFGLRKKHLRCIRRGK